MVLIRFIYKKFNDYYKKEETNHFRISLKKKQKITKIDN